MIAGISKECMALAFLPALKNMCSLFFSNYTFVFLYYLDCWYIVLVNLLDTEFHFYQSLIIQNFMFQKLNVSFHLDGSCLFDVILFIYVRAVLNQVINTAAYCAFCFPNLPISFAMFILGFSHIVLFLSPPNWTIP